MGLSLKGPLLFFLHIGLYAGNYGDNNLMDENLNAIPKYEYEKISDISIDDLKAMGVKAVGIDIDNTTAYDSSFKVLSGVRSWIKNVQKAGFKVIIITNTYSFRAKHFSRKMGHIPYIAMARKPLTKNFFVAAKKLDIDVSELAMIGDQLFTDIQGANAAGAVSVLVHYAKPEVLFGSKFKRLRERERNYLKNKGYIRKKWGTKANYERENKNLK